MKKVLIAMDNEKLAERVKRTGKYIVENIKKVTKDKVLEYLSENKIDVIVTKDTLVGEGTKEIYLKQVRLLAPESKIVLFANELTESYIEFLANNNITNIIEDENENIYFLELLELIESIYPKIIYKSNKNCYSGFESDNMEVSIKYLPKIFAVYGTSGVGKSYFSSLLSIIASKKNKNNTLLIDMDLSSSAMDIYNNVDKNNDSLMKVMEDIDNETFSPISFMDSISNSKKNSKLSFLVNNSSFLDIQNRFSPIYYKKIYDSSIEKYDTTIVDLPDSPFLDVVPFTLDYVDIVFFVINPNFISIRQAIKKLELMTKIWKIPVNKIYIVINNKKSSSLEISQIEMLLKGYHILCEIESSDLVEKVINGMSEISLDNVKNIENIINVLCNNKKSNTNNYEEINIRNKLSKKISEIFGVKTSVN